MLKHLSSPIWLFAAISWTACAVDVEDSSAETQVATDLGTDVGRLFAVVPAKAPLFGRSITRWTEAWWHWLSEVPADRNPELDVNADCANGQDDPVFFLPPLQMPSFRRRCRVRFGQPVLVGVQAVLNSYPCPDPAFEPAPGQTLEEFLREGAISYNNLYSNLAASIDGRAVELRSHRHTTGLFTNEVHPSLLSHIPDPCLTGTPQPAVGDGWYLVTIMSPGQHRVRITATNPGGQPVERIYDVEVVR